MLELKNTSSLDAATLLHLTNQQAIIDALPVNQQAEKAGNLWDAKRSAQPGRDAFKVIKGELLSMCVSTELCNYCEHNEATDVEHIYPKSFFPGRTFKWANYLLACKQCHRVLNTEYKLDKFYVFSPARSSTATELRRKQRPPSDDAAFINPRVEDPMVYLSLDIKEKSFHLIPHPDLTDPRDIAKAERTLSVLQIGEREALANAREAALIFFQHRLDQYRKVEATSTWEELEEFVQDPHLLNRANSFAAERQLMMDNIKKSIMGHQHPTVWREMQRQHLTLNKSKRLFQAVPIALTWV
jgi:HNH endonuclease